MDPQRLTQVGVGAEGAGHDSGLLAAARGRSERRFGTWQGRLPPELRLAGIQTLEEANRFLRETSIPEMNRKFSVPAAEKGHAFVPVRGQDLDRIFSVQQERVVGKDNTVQWGERVWQIERTPWRGTLAGCRVTICEHLDGRVTIVYGPVHGELQICQQFRESSVSCYDAEMCNLVVLFIHLLTTLVRLARPGGVRSLVAE